MSQTPKKIYTFNAREYLLYPIMKQAFTLSDMDVFQTISDEFEVLQDRLAQKKIDYGKLKGALIPNQDKDKFETCLVIDSTKIDRDDYGYYIFEKLIPLMDKQSTYSVLVGDYIDISRDVENSQLWLRQVLNEVLHRCHKSEYQHSGQYYLIYFNRLTGNQRWKIVEGLLEYSWFTGFADLTYDSLFKFYISNILCNMFIKNQGKIISMHPSDYPDIENINMPGYPFEENGFTFVSIHENSFGAFLSYKIETPFIDEQDVGFSFNALFPKFDSFEKIQLEIKEEKWNRYLADKEKGKGVILEKLGYHIADKEKFVKEIYKKICANYLYNLTQNEYGDRMFNVCVELPTIDGNIRKTTIALKYLPDHGEMQVVTIT